jgi:LPPG:FO 2-phospho-L-lactate transferase
VGVSPMIGEAAISGPAHKLMIACGSKASALGVAECYSDFLDRLLIANEDRTLSKPIASLAMDVRCTDIRMTSLAEKKRLAREVLALAGK